MVINEKILNTIINSLISETMANHPHTPDNLCNACIIRKSFLHNKLIQHVTQEIYLCSFIEKQNDLINIVDHLALGFELGYTYATTEYMEQSFNAKTKDKS